jgi:hypothetical protein
MSIGWDMHWWELWGSLAMFPQLHDLRLYSHDIELCPVKPSVAMESNVWWVGESIFVVIVYKGYGFLVGNLYECHVFLWSQESGSKSAVW